MGEVVGAPQVEDKDAAALQIDSERPCCGFHEDAIRNSLDEDDVLRSQGL